MKRRERRRRGRVCRELLYHDSCSVTTKIIIYSTRASQIRVLLRKIIRLAVLSETFRGTRRRVNAGESVPVTRAVPFGVDMNMECGMATGAKRHRGDIFIYYSLFTSVKKIKQQYL